MTVVSGLLSVLIITDDLDDELEALLSRSLCFFILSLDESKVSFLLPEFGREDIIVLTEFLLQALLHTHDLVIVGNSISICTFLNLDLRGQEQVAADLDVLVAMDSDQTLSLL